MIRSRDTAGGQAPWIWNCQCMESADSAVQAAVVQVVIELTGRTQTFCGCSIEDCL